MASEKISDKVKVVVRVRPLSENEIHSNFRSTIATDEINCCLMIKNPAGHDGEPPKIFTFDAVFGPDSKQLDVYTLAARPIVENVLEGYNGTIFAYGQTGTGKTFTMEGIRSIPEKKGVIPNSFAHIFGHIAKAEEDKKFLVRVSYLEIYNEEVRDLLRQDQNARLEVKERPDVGVYVKDLITHVVHNADEMDKIMTLGNKNRATGSTNMNAHSSRSHAIFTITIECSEKGSDKKQHWRVGKLHLVDLAYARSFTNHMNMCHKMSLEYSLMEPLGTIGFAGRERNSYALTIETQGSERQSKTGASGIRLKEASKINLSLSTLGNVISALVDGRSTHIPYRNSKLTRLLQDSLGGNSKTLMVANVGPATYNYDESISTLRYANRAKSICNRAKINEDPKDALLRKLQEEIKALKSELEEGEVEEEESSDDDGLANEKKKKKLKDEDLLELRRKLEEEKKELSERKDMEEEERNKVKIDLDQQEKELKRAEKEQEALKQRLLGLERKILIGGENLLEKAEEQDKLLEDSATELEERKRKQEELKEAINQKEAERIDMEERYSSLQDEAAGKTRKMKKVWTMLLSAKSELGDLQAEHQREMEALLESVRLLSREHKLNQLIIDSFIPSEYQDMIDRYVHWNEDIGEWQLKCVAYTGNNMRKQLNGDAAGDAVKQPQNNEMWNVYSMYTRQPVVKAKPKPKPKPRPKKSAIPRPKQLVSPRKYM